MLCALEREARRWGKGVGERGQLGDDQEERRQAGCHCEKLQPEFFNLWFYQVLIFSFQIKKYKLYFPHCLLMGQLLKLTLLLMQFVLACSEFFQQNVDTYIATQDSKFCFISFRC